MKSKKGFTLTELLVVILIVGVLLSMSTVAAIRHLNKTKNKSSIATAKSYITAVNDYNLISKNEKEDLIVSSNVSSINPMLNESLSGQKPKSGYVLVENNKAAYAMLCIDGKTVKYEDKKFSVIDDNCKSSKNLTDLPDIPHSTTEDKTYVCKRATTLHTEVCYSNHILGDNCEQDPELMLVSGLNNIWEINKPKIYGNLGTKGTLSTGDAFDCDVNGDGIYDSNTERFYYINDMSKNMAMLIYYNNVENGIPKKKSYYKYNDPAPGYHGPDILLSHLPSTSQWSNVSLSNNYRDIYMYDSNTVRVSNFSYAGKAARLLSYRELPGACLYQEKITENCTFLLENTEFSTNNNDVEAYSHDDNFHFLDYELDDGYWLEDSGDRFITGSGSAIKYAGERRTIHGVRPVIEVLKSQMEI